MHYTNGCQSVDQVIDHLEENKRWIINNHWRPLPQLIDGLTCNIDWPNNRLRELVSRDRHHVMQKDNDGGYSRRYKYSKEECAILRPVLTSFVSGDYLEKYYKFNEDLTPSWDCNTNTRPKTKQLMENMKRINIKLNNQQQFPHMVNDLMRKISPNDLEKNFCVVANSLGEEFQSNVFDEFLDWVDNTLINPSNEIDPEEEYNAHLG
uniref:Uncharacterized protein n=1 Tax=Megaviridae environmental sample TaxID=1737588 RepID=A0A5J6VJC8_9VIRU|nr:MAG: hypothetical protein [Megaviridae environmental sample]